MVTSRIIDSEGKERVVHVRLKDSKWMWGDTLTPVRELDIVKISLMNEVRAAENILENTTAARPAYLNRLTQAVNRLKEAQYWLSQADDMKPDKIYVK